MKTFRALVVNQVGQETTLGIERWTPDQLFPGDVTIRVEYSSVNYKDALASRADGKVARGYPLVPGIDMAGTVEASTDPHYQPGDRVLAHGYDLGVAHHGGFAELARVPAGWVVPLPGTLSTRQAMAIGTAGFTAGLSVERMEHMGLRPANGTVLVTGASGGVGSTAVAILAARGYAVAASTGSTEAHGFLHEIGAVEIVDRGETSQTSDRPLDRARWAGVVDAVGGSTLAYAMRTVLNGGSIAACGNTGGATVQTTVFPFILRGINVLGIDSANLSLERRTEIWQRLAADLRPPHLEESITREVRLEQVLEILGAIYQGDVRGRILVRVAA